MLKIKFQKIEKSQLVVDAVEEKILEVTSRFPKLSKCQIDISLFLENSSALPSSDLFILKLQVMSGLYEGVLISKEHCNFYSALNELCEEVLNFLEKVEAKAKTKVNTKTKMIDFSKDLKIYRSTSLNK
ncbi:MAG: hypothetical protein QE271_08545 [Bacteriovoracaceae bacterium]|nr:hypothetical protein [Bacteriovoracaceae bacterium]